VTIFLLVSKALCLTHETCEACHLHQRIKKVPIDEFDFKGMLYLLRKA